MQKENLENLQQVNTILFGRVTFKMMEAFWPREQTKAYPEVQQYMNAARKHTFSTTVNRSAWQHSYFHEQLNKETIISIKEKAENDIVILGGGMSSRELHRLGLLDEYTLFLDPQLLGRGKQFFREMPPGRLQLLDSRVFPSGIVRLNYKVVK
ncbi:MAG: dihydrofolate reductase family protein [Niabella sp.]|nr:dihydrofolate reductase family protein [Niabella sp.]